MNNGILLKVEQVVILFGMVKISIVLFDHGLFMITLNLVCGSMHLIVNKSLPLKEVLSPLLLLYKFLGLAIALLLLYSESLFEFLDQPHNLCE